MTQRERDKLITEIKIIFISVGGIATLAYAIYFIIDTIKKWY